MFRHVTRVERLSKEREPSAPTRVKCETHPHSFLLPLANVMYCLHKLTRQFQL